MTESSTIAPAAPASGPELATAERRAAIEPFLELVGKSPVSTDADRGTTQVLLGSRVIQLDAWEFSVLTKGLSRRSDGSREVEIDDWPVHLAEGVAFQARYLSHLSCLQDGPPPAPSELKTLRADLIVDAALGLALQEEMQRDVNNLVAVGALEEAKKLTSFRHKIGQGVGRLKEIVGEIGFAEAEARATQIVAPAPRQPRLAAEPDDLHERPAQFRRDLGHAPVKHLQIERRDRLRPLLLTLAFCVLAYGFFFFTAREAPGPPAIDPAIFLHVDGVQRVDVRAPSLFVTVHAKDWRELTDEGQLELVGSVGAIAEKNGYSGAHFRSTAGVTVGEWLAKTGVKIVPSGSDGS
jgi:hypothetical protein